MYAWTRGELCDRLITDAQTIRKHRLCHCNSCTMAKRDAVWVSTMLNEGKFEEEGCEMATPQERLARIDAMRDYLQTIKETFEAMVDELCEAEIKAREDLEDLRKEK